MSNYRIITSKRNALVETEQGFIVRAEPPFHLFIGCDFRKLRDLGDSLGWQIVPVIERTHPTLLEVDGRKFELKWRGDVLVRVSEHLPCEVRDTRFEELPEILKRLI